MILYDFWFVLAMLLWLLPFWLDYTMPKTTIGGILAALVLQQIAILARTGVSVAWLGSEVSYFEANATFEEATPDSLDEAEDATGDTPVEDRLAHEALEAESDKTADVATDEEQRPES